MKNLLFHLLLRDNMFPSVTKTTELILKFELKCVQTTLFSHRYSALCHSSHMMTSSFPTL